MAQKFEVNAIAVWINVPLERALEQNAKRAPDEVVPEVALRSVFGLIETPTLEEGFLEVIEVTPNDYIDDCFVPQSWLMSSTSREDHNA